VSPPANAASSFRFARTGALTYRRFGPLVDELAICVRCEDLTRIAAASRRSSLGTMFRSPMTRRWNWTNIGLTNLIAHVASPTTAANGPP
jgi:hypothetical protein